MAEEIERLVVGIEGDYSKLLNDTKTGVAGASKELDKLSVGPKEAQKQVSGLANLIKGPLMGAVTSLIALFSVNAAVTFFQNIGKAAIAASAEFEVFETQFSTLLGSASQAKKRIEELAAFGQSTPFELPEIVEANRLLQTFGGTILATGENLRRIGDSAAAVNAPFKEVSFWTGRLYSAIQSGRPFGEAAARLSELGILSGDVRTKLEDMQKAGADGTEIWAAYSEMIDSRFAGAMDRLSKTFQGVMSNLADFQGMLLREGGESLFEGMREDAIEFYDIINQPEVKDALVGIAEGFGEIADNLREAATGPLLKGLQDIDPQELEQLGDALSDFGTALGHLLNTDAVNINGVVTAMTALVDAITTVTNLMDKGLAVFERAGVAFLGMVNPLTSVANGFVALNDILKKTTGLDISDWTRSAVDAQKSAQDQANELAAAYADYGETLAAAAETTEEAGVIVEETADQFAAAAEKVEQAATQMIDLEKDIAGKREEVEADHGEKIAEIIEAYEDKKADIIANREEAIANLERDLAKKRADIAEDAAEALEELEREVAQKRIEINEQAQQALEDLQRGTRQAIARERQQADLKESREEENHQRDLQRMRKSYLDDLTDAVKNRDARAIVDLRRRYNRERRESEDSHRTEKRRGREDTEARIEEIRERERVQTEEIRRNQAQQLADLEQHEQQRREEIAKKQAEQLANLAENEALKREEIEKSFQEQMAKNEENFAAQMEKENTQYAERKAALDEAMAKRLEDIAKELADEKDIDEEGAKAILEALNKTFGIGGDIDQLMEGFAARRRQKMTVQIEFENQTTGMGSTNTPTTPAAGGGQGQGTHPGQIPGFAEGGSIIATKPTVAMFGEAGPELAQFIPLGQMANNQGAPKKMTVELKMSGSAPPGIRGGDRDAIASTLVAALREAGIDAR